MSFEKFKIEAKKIEGTYDKHLEAIRGALETINFSDAEEAHLAEKLTMHAESVGGIREALIHTARDPLAMFILSSNMGGLRNDEKMLNFYGFTISATKATYENLQLLLKDRPAPENETLKEGFNASPTMQEAQKRVDYVLTDFLPKMENVLCDELGLEPDVMSSIIAKEDLKFENEDNLKDLHGVQAMARLNKVEWLGLSSSLDSGAQPEVKEP